MTSAPKAIGEADAQQLLLGIERAAHWSRRPTGSAPRVEPIQEGDRPFAGSSSMASARNIASLPSISGERHALVESPAAGSATIMSLGKPMISVR